MLVVQSHLQTLVGVLIVHIMNDVERIYINLCKPLHHSLVLVHYVIIVEVIALNCTIIRTYLLAADFINTAVDCIKQALCKVCSCAEELHFLADFH